MPDLYKATGPCGICGVVLDWYQHQTQRRVGFYPKEKTTGEDHWANCPGAWNLHLRLAAIKA